jgi:hypothetical protein
VHGDRADGVVQLQHALQEQGGVEHHAAAAEQWIMSLTATEALRKAGILSHNFWLKSFIK